MRMNGSVFCTVFPMAIMSAGFGVGLYIIVQSIAGVNSEDDVPAKGPFYDPRDPLAHFKKPKCGELQSDGGVRRGTHQLGNATGKVSASIDEGHTSPLDSTGRFNLGLSHTTYMFNSY